MPGDLLLYLEDIRDAIASIRSYAGDRAFGEFAGDPMCLDAVVLRFITIGEAVKQIPADITAGHPEIEWRKIAGLRDISVHSYYWMMSQRIVGFTQTELGPLEDAVEAMIREVE